MKTSIPSDIWETKRAQIAVLYKEEEWPLKQVIKKIRSDDFNPTETQLRSRLKKWGVTKPSRQRRKKPSSEKTCASAGLNVNHLGLRRNSEGGSQLPSLHIPAYFFHESTLGQRRQSVPLISHPSHHQSTVYARGDRPGTGLVSTSEQLLHAPSPQYPVSSMPHYLPNLPTLQPHGQHFSAGGSVKPSCSESEYMSHSRSLSSSTMVSPSDSFSSLAWPLHGSAADREPPASISPTSPWDCTPPETAQPCSATSIYMTESMSLPQNCASCDKQYGNYQDLPSPDLEFLQALPPSKTWRRPSVSSEKGTVSGSDPIDCPDPSKQRQEGMYQRDAQSASLSNRQLSDTRSQSPVLMPELPPSCTEAESHFQDMSPVDGMTLEYLLCSPHIT